MNNDALHDPYTCYVTGGPQLTLFDTQAATPVIQFQLPMSDTLRDERIMRGTL